jgi:hypothetical protein
MTTDEMILREQVFARHARPVTPTQAETDLTLIAGYPEAIDRRMAMDARRMARRWGWTIGQVRVLIAARAARRAQS